MWLVSALQLLSKIYRIEWRQINAIFSSNGKKCSRGAWSYKMLALEARIWIIRCSVFKQSKLDCSIYYVDFHLIQSLAEKYV